jgi:hypothetical protein
MTPITNMENRLGAAKATHHFDMIRTWKHP